LGGPSEVTPADVEFIFDLWHDECVPLSTLPEIAVEPGIIDPPLDRSARHNAWR
jgi:hypothetical protein